MKRIKLFSLVVGLHVAVVGLIFIVPACDTMPGDSGGTESMVTPMGAAPARSDHSEGEELHPSFNAGIPVASSAISSGPRHSPTRPEEVLLFAPMETEAETLEPIPMTDIETMTTYVVERGDSLWGIAKQHGVVLQGLLEANGFDRQTTIYPGQDILIPSYPGQIIYPPVGASEKLQSSLPENVTPVTLSMGNEGMHVVQAGETPSGIARRYGMSAAEFMQINEIADPRKLRIGQSVIVRTLEQNQIPSTASLESRANEGAMVETEEMTTPVVAEVEPSLELPLSLVELEGLPFESEEDIPVIPIETESEEEGEETDQE